ncbi:MAG: quinoprotein dehydrogenase-associated SoxYZ-like carrier [Hyphomicrobium sp.]|uniref:quinoprotein dehydrogenase-associated SoxYZ-like carrier n=1 Tax=Hyphomicrobium sp. TaxID=82 RepID=UPI0039E60E7F
MNANTLQRLRLSLGILFLLVGSIGSAARADDDPWPGIRKDLFGTRQLTENGSALQIFAPNQADDAAVVPVTVNIASSVVPNVKSLTLIIDRNPVPVAATLAFGDGYRRGPDIGERTIATRIRVDAFSRVRAILETSDGSLFMASKFVIGSGGCSAPASKDPEVALAELGKTHLILRQDESIGKDWREARIMIKHPNFTGMQMNAKTGEFTPARFINSIEVKQGETVLWSMEGGISISEDPNFRFTFGTNNPADLEFTATDTAGTKFRATAAMSPPS